MPTDFFPESKMFRAVFEDEVAALGGTISDTFHEKTWYLARSLHPGVREVGPRDTVTGGVAIRVDSSAIRVCPYLFRQVCGNGMILARTFQARHIEQVDIRDFDEVAIQLRETVRACASDEAFTEAATRTQRTRLQPADLAMGFLMRQAGRSSLSTRGLSREILARLTREPERQTGFGVLNALTSLARDTKDPVRRWDLEELGGALVRAITRSPRPTPSPMRIAAAK